MAFFPGHGRTREVDASRWRSAVGVGVLFALRSRERRGSGYDIDPGLISSTRSVPSDSLDGHRCEDTRASLYVVGTARVLCCICTGKPSVPRRASARRFRARYVRRQQGRIAQRLPHSEGGADPRSDDHRAHRMEMDGYYKVGRDRSATRGDPARDLRAKRARSAVPAIRPWGEEDPLRRTGDDSAI